jgi:hypothetical protein
MSETKTPVEPTVVTAPEIAGEPAQDPNIIGALTPEEARTFQNMRSKMSQLTMEIGNLEVRKARILGMLSELDEQGTKHLMDAGRRLGLPEGAQFQLLPDGRIRNTTPPAAPATTN